MPEYTPLLAANEVGRNFLSEIRKKCELTIVTKPADAPSDSTQKKLGESADALYADAMPIKSTVNFIKLHPFMSK